LAHILVVEGVVGNLILVLLEISALYSSERILQIDQELTVIAMVRVAPFLTHGVENVDHRKRIANLVRPQVYHTERPSCLQHVCRHTCYMLLVDDGLCKRQLFSCPYLPRSRLICS